jgi:2-oxoglutarate dehydrogenase E1 component
VTHLVPDLATSRVIEELYEQWLEAPGSVPPEWNSYFADLKTALPTNGQAPGTVNGAAVESAGDHPGALGTPRDQAGKEGRVNALIWGYRDVGYVYADLNPLGGYMTPELRYMYYTMEGNYEKLTLKEFGLSEEDLDREVPTGGYFEPKRTTLRNLLHMLRETYCSHMGVEILHIQNKPMRRWLIEKIESPSERPQWPPEQRIRFQKDLIKAEELEHFIHSNFIGQKRFSLEGGEVLIPALRYLLDAAGAHGLQEMVLGMAHRGRLNVFTNALRKPAVETFAKFIDNYQPHIYGGTGDVKYHLGHNIDYKTPTGETVHVSLVANPSHLESVDPVVEGKCRGIQRRRGDKNRKKVLPVLIHGDAAFSGQGVVAETLNLMQLKGYRTGGTVHIILNNQIGFTTASRDARSSFFATDIAKSMPVPIFHVNGDHPEAVVRAIDLAMRYRQKFGYDAVVDIFCYRRLGHNEADEPTFTHPIMYSMIDEHDSVPVIYGNYLDSEGVFSTQDQDAFKKRYRDVLKSELEKAKGGYKPNMDDALEQGEWQAYRRDYEIEPVETGVEKKTLDTVARTLTTIPQDFSPHPKLERFVKDRKKRLEEGANFDWALAESLAFGTLLLEGYSIRLSGEDSGRGTFSQRHAVWWDRGTDRPKTYTALQHVGEVSGEEQGTFSVYDSPLSEFAVLGFDYGYSLAQPKVLVAWEAQFGDFVNGAQVIIDQFIAAGESKWFRTSGLVMLLPHGYEGQGPEHSSAHFERFLQLCADDNMQVCYPSTPAQYYHMLRRQMVQPFRKPLIVMTPKSLLRNKRCVSEIGDFTSGAFRLVIDDPEQPKKARRLLLCTGKVYYDLLERKERDGADDVAIIRVEQLYPFPHARLAEAIGRYPDTAEIFWVQEESENRGAYHFIQNRIDGLLQTSGRRLRYVGRPESPSPATGSFKQHQEELDAFLTAAFAVPDTQSKRS